MLRRLGSLTPRRASETAEEREARIEKKKSRSRKSDPVTAFSTTAGFADPFSSPRPDAKSASGTFGAELLMESPKANKTSGSAEKMMMTPPSSAKKPRLCQAEDILGRTPAQENPNMIPATPTSSAKKQAFDRGAGVGLLASPVVSSKKMRLSPLEHTPKVAVTTPNKTKRSLYSDLQSPGPAGNGDPTPAAPDESGESPVPPRIAGTDETLRAAGAGRPPVAPDSIGNGEMPTCPRLSVNDKNTGVGTPTRGSPGADPLCDDTPSKARKLSEDEDAKPLQSSPSLASLGREVQRVTSEDPALRASAPAAFSQPTVPTLNLPGQGRRPQSARNPPTRPPAFSRAGSALLSGAKHAASALSPRRLMSPGRLMSPRRMMSPGRVKSARADPPPTMHAAAEAAATTPSNAPAAAAEHSDPFATAANEAAKPRAPASRAWLPSPRPRWERPKGTASKDGIETGDASQASAREAVDPAEALVQPMLSAVYGRAITSAEVAAATSACPEVTWLAQCALLCPLPAGWRKVPAESDDVGTSPELYACELSGEIGEQPPHLPRFSKLARLLLHAVTHPAEAHTAAAWLKIEIEEAFAESLRLQESWCRSVDPTSGTEFWHNPMTGKSTWESPAAHAAYTAAVAERILDTEPFKGVRAAEAQTQRNTPRPQPPSARARAQSQSEPLSTRGLHSATLANPDSRPIGQRSPAPSQKGRSSGRSGDTEMFDMFEDLPTPVANSAPKSARHRHSSHSGDFAAPASARHRRSASSQAAPAPGHQGEQMSNTIAEPQRSARRKQSNVDDDGPKSGRHRHTSHTDESDAPVRHRRSKHGSARRSKQEAAAPMQPAAKEFDIATVGSSSEAEAEVFNMATPKGRKVVPQLEPLPQAAAQPQQTSQAQSTECAIALAGAAAALANAAASLSARGTAQENNAGVAALAMAAASLSARGSASDSSMIAQPALQEKHMVASLHCEAPAPVPKKRCELIARAAPAPDVVPLASAGYGGAPPASLAIPAPPAGPAPARLAKCIVSSSREVPAEVPAPPPPLAPLTPSPPCEAPVAFEVHTPVASAASPAASDWTFRKDPAGAGKQPQFFTMDDPPTDVEEAVSIPVPAELPQVAAVSAVGAPPPPPRPQRPDAAKAELAKSPAAKKTPSKLKMSVPAMPASSPLKAIPSMPASSPLKSVPPMPSSSPLKLSVPAMPAGLELDGNRVGIAAVCGA